MPHGGLAVPRSSMCTAMAGWRDAVKQIKNYMFFNMRFRLFLLVSVMALMATGLVSCDKGFMRDGVNYELNDEGVAVAPSKLKQYVGNVKIPDSVLYEGKKYAVTEIEADAFKNCKMLIAVTIPGTIKTIGTGAFQGCKGLKAIHCQSTTPLLIDASTFKGIYYEQVTLYVPLSASSSYGNDPEWGKFNISEEGETVLKGPAGKRPVEDLPGKGTHSF